MDAPIKDKDGKQLISEETQDARWAEYFSEILNRPPPETKPDIPVAVEDLEIETSPPPPPLQGRNIQCHQGPKKQ